MIFLLLFFVIMIIRFAFIYIFYIFLKWRIIQSFEITHRKDRNVAIY